MAKYRAYVKQSLQLHREQKISDLTFLKKKFPAPFSSLSVQLQVQKYNCTPTFLMTLLKSFPRNFCIFTPAFDPLTLTKLQLQLHNSPFTTANHILQLQKL